MLYRSINIYVLFYHVVPDLFIRTMAHALLQVFWAKQYLLRYIDL